MAQDGFKNKIRRKDIGEFSERNAFGGDRHSTSIPTYLSIRESQRGHSASYPLSFRRTNCASGILNYLFRRALGEADPRNTIAYFWPGAPLSLIRHARKRGFWAVREMINTCRAHAKPVLDEAYDRLGLQPDHKITQDFVDREDEELSLYDYIFSPNIRVEKSLIEIGVESSKILRSSYGWLPSSFVSSVAEESRQGFRALFVGGICVRKGVPQLLAAWKKSGVAGELLLVGEVEPALKPLKLVHTKNSRIFGWLALTSTWGVTIGPPIFLYSPSLEEGDPLVTYEAAGCGLPVVTTPMGRAIS